MELWYIPYVSRRMWHHAAEEAQALGCWRARGIHGVLQERNLRLRCPAKLPKP